MWPYFDQQTREAVDAVLASGQVNYWTGEEGRQFENEFAAWCDTRHAIALANGTVALDLALVGLGIGAQNGGESFDEVIVTPRSFMASVSCVANAGARPIFADVERESGNLTSETIAAVITEKTKAVIVVHLAGHPCDMDAIMALAQKHDIRIIEDCAQAHGAKFNGRSVGSFGDVAAWSFCQDKIISTGGEGGMVTTNNRKLWSKMWSYKDHGKKWEAVYERQHAPGFRWLHESFGTNWRMTEMQAAIGRVQLRYLEEWTRIRTMNAQMLDSALAPFCGIGKPVRKTLPENNERDLVHAYYKYYAYVQPENLPDGWTRDRIVDEISKCGVTCLQGSCSEIYLEKAFEGTGWVPRERLAVAKELGETSIMFLVHPTQSKQEMTKVCEAINTVFSFLE